METVLLALRVLLSLAVVLGLLWLLQRRLRNGARAERSGRVVNLVARQAISPKASVVVVDIEGKRFLLGVTEQSVNVLHTGELPAELSGAEIFAESMNRAVEAAPGTVPYDVEPRRAHVEPMPLQRRSGRRAARTASHWEPQHNTGLTGSILSPNTWKQTAAVLRQGRHG